MEEIIKQVRFLKIYSLSLTALLTGMFLLSFTDTGKQKFKEIDVERINIVNSKNQNRVVITSEDKLPEVVLNGKVIKGRIVKPAGIIFYDDKGNETGGIGITKTKKGEMNMMIFDYSNSEGIGFHKYESDDGKKYFANFIIQDRAPLSEEVGEGHTRIQLGNENKDASLQLFDAEGLLRIKMGVDSMGVSTFIMYDDKGKQTLKLPQ